MKRNLAAFLAVAMMVSVLSGCASSEPAATEAAATEAAVAATQAATQAAAAEAAPAAEAKPDTWLCDEKTTLTILTYDGVNNSFTPPSNDLPFWKYLEDRTNVHIDWEIVPYSGYPEVIAARLAAATDLPDIVVTTDYQVNNNAGKNGVFADLNAKWDLFPNTEKYFSDQGQNYRASLKNEDGTFYAIAGSVQPVEGHICFHYNTEWMKKLGKEVPKTLDEFTELLEAMKAAGDLNGNGEADEVIFTANGVNGIGSALGSAFGLNSYESWDQFSVDANGVVFPEYTSENQKAYISYLNDLYTKGLLDPEISSMTADMVSEKCAADKVGVFVYYSAFAITYGKLTSKGVEDPNGEWYTIGGPLASEWNNNKGYYMRREVIQEVPTSISADSKNIDLACKWLDVLFADPEVLQVRTCGFEGEDYEYDANGNFQLIMPADGSAWSINTKGCGQIVLAYNQTKEQLLNSKRQYQWYMDEYDALRENTEWKAPVIPRVIAYSDSEQEKIDDCRTDVLDYFKEMRDKFVTGEASIEKDWDTYCQNIDKLGLPTLTEVWQSVYDRTR